jgi:hypothetical protein
LQKPDDHDVQAAEWLTACYAKGWTREEFRRELHETGVVKGSDAPPGGRSSSRRERGALQRAFEAIIARWWRAIDLHGGQEREGALPH